MTTLAARIEWDLDGRPLDGRLLRMLATIDEQGSLRAASLEIGLGYRATWNLLLALQRALPAPVVELTRGRGARLTPAGQTLLRAMRAARERVQPHLVGTELTLTAPAARPPRLRLALSHDPLLAARREAWGERGVAMGFHGSAESLDLYAAGQADAAGFHVPLGRDPDAPRGELLGRLRPERDALLGFAIREQGLMVAPGNPKKLHGLADLARRGVRFVNRQAGSGTRLLLDELLALAGVPARGITGYGIEEFTHDAVAATVRSGAADAAFGLRAAAARFDLEFIPLQREAYMFACARRRLESPAIRALRELLASRELREAARRMAGYKLARVGEAGTVRQLEAGWPE
jgi:putative molybdopterin biosynthesis protein